MMRSVIIRLLPGVLVLVGCAKDIPLTPSPNVVQAVFDPSQGPCQGSADCTSGACTYNKTLAKSVCSPAIPTPTDLAKNQATGLLNVPVADSTSNPAQSYLDTYLNTLNGFPATATAEMKFSGLVDETKVNKDTILVYDAADLLNPTLTSVKPVADLVFEHKVVNNASMVRIWNYAGWQRGKTYVIYVLGGDKGIKDKSGTPVVRSAQFQLAAAENPLCQWDSSKAFDKSSGTCAAPLGTGPAAGCCTFNFSSLIESSVARQVEADSANEGKTTEEKALLVKAAVLSTATDFERLRQAFNKLLGPIGASVSGIDRDDVVLLWAFSTVSMNEAQFDPVSTVPHIPTPTDLLRDPKTGIVQIPVSPTASDAEKEFTNNYLNTLDGFVPAATAALEFTAELDTTTATAGNILVFEVGATSMTAVSDAKVAIDSAAKKVTITRAPSWKRGARYAVFAVGGTGGLKNKDVSLAAAPKRSGVMQLALSPYPLCTFDATTKICTDVKVSSIIDDPASKTGGSTAIAKATKFEMIRQGYDPLLKLFEASGKGKREDVVSLWTFSIVSQTEILLDPTAGVIPFPNAMLLDATTGKVNIPAQPGESTTEKLLREQVLNTRDGFSTQGTLFAATSGLVDKASLAFGVSAVSFNIDKAAPEVMKFDFVETAPAITATPMKPLDEKTMYAIVLFSKLKAGQLAPDGTGIKDDKGRRVVPATFMALLRSKAKLTDASGKSAVLLLSDAQAALAEPYRAQMQQFFDGLEANALMPIKRQDIVAAWMFKTQTTTDKLPLMRAMPWSLFGTAGTPIYDSNQPKWTGTYDATLAGFPTSVPSTDIAGWVKDGLFTSWNAIDEAGTTAMLADPTKGKPSAVPFLMTIPKGTMPATGWPVAIFQHGIFDLKADGLAIANSLAKGGIAMIAFDAMYHGDRSWCTANDQCASGGTCTVATGKCSTALAMDTTGKDFPVPGPVASGKRFLWSDNPYLPLALPSNFLQYVIDGAALLRGIAVVGLGAPGAWTGLTGFTGQKLDPTQVHFVGHSLGSMMGTLLMAADPLPSRVTFNVPGAPFVTVGRTSTTYKSLLEGLLQKFNVTEGSLAALKLINILTWILDPSDSGNFAPYVTTKQLPDLVKAKVVPGALVPKKAAICQLATNDETVPKTPNGDYFAGAAGVDTTKTIYTGQGHGFLLKGTPDAKATEAAQAQMVYWFNTPTATDKTVCTPNLTAGTCTP